MAPPANATRQSNLRMLAVWILTFIAAASAATVEVATTLGNIRGVTLKSRLGNDFFAFRGIRYANSPVGELRFKSPQPVDSWKPNVFDATDDGPMCPQSGYTSADYSEDCLRLNVYSKNLDENALKPVIIYMHPGGFYSTSGQSKNFAGPELMMDRGIVLVTINYRLGTLGYLAAGTADAPGNAGLKDQVESFKWVRDHIFAFGGDPDSVTLMGYSAGSLSVGLHMASPMSVGLFHRGIAMSASPVSQIHYPSEQLDLAKKQARLVNCPTVNVDAMVKCLRETPVDDFTRTQDAMFEFGNNPVLNWLPVVEEDFGQERFIIEDPTKSFEEGRIQRVPLIIGMTRDEFVGIAYDVLQNETLTTQLNDDWDTVAPICFQYERNTPKSKLVSTVLRKRYLNDMPLRVNGPFEQLGKIFSDGIIGFGVHRMTHLAARYVPVYYYRFSYRGRYSHFIIENNKPYGTVHHDDLLYLLRVPAYAPLFTKFDPEDRTIERMTRMWTQFAETSDPNNPDDEYLRYLRWRPFSLRRENYLEIGDEFINRQGLYLERFAIWEILFPLNSSVQSSKRHRHGNSNRIRQRYI